MPTTISTFFTTVILTLALVAPNLAKESQNLVPEVTAPVSNFTALQAPKTAFLSIEEYAHHAAQETGISTHKFIRLIACESRWQEDAAGDNGTSIGLLQFKKPTFAHFTQKYGITDADIEDPNHQIDLASRMIANGHLNHWKNCARKIGWTEN